MAIAIALSSCGSFIRQRQVTSPSPQPISPTPDQEHPGSPRPSTPLAPTSEPASPTPTDPSPSPPIAQRPDRPDSSLADCEGAQTQAELTACANAQAEAADDRLNEVYQQVRDRIQGTAEDALLVDAQLAWIEFRDRECDFVVRSYEGGSIAALIYSSCVARVTEQRTEELRNYLQTLEQTGF